MSFSEGQGLFELSIASCREFRSQAPPISRATIYSNSQISGTLATNSRHHITTLSSGRPNGHSAWYSSRASEVKTTVQGICRSSLRLLRGWLGVHPGCCANNRGYADNHRCCCFFVNTRVCLWRNAHREGEERKKAGETGISRIGERRLCHSMALAPESLTPWTCVFRTKRAVGGGAVVVS